MCRPTARQHREPWKAQVRFAANSEAVLIRIELKPRSVLVICCAFPEEGESLKFLTLVGGAVCARRHSLVADPGGVEFGFARVLSKGAYKTQPPFNRTCPIGGKASSL
jgi:hypothetical protein